MVRYQGDGCNRCNHNGVTGRLVVAEILVPNKKILTAIKEGDDLNTRSIWMESESGETIIQAAKNKIIQGIIDPIHVEKEIGSLNGV